MVSDPPRLLDMDVASRRLDALDELPRPTLVTCRTGPRSSALVYLCEGLRSGESSEEVLARAERDGAPFVGSAEWRAWVEQGLRELSGRVSQESATNGVEADQGRSFSAVSACESR